MTILPAVGETPVLNSGRLSCGWVPKSNSVMLRPMVSRPVCVDVKHPPAAQHQIFITVSCEFLDVGRYLWREDGSAVYNCCWPSPGRQFSDPSPAGLVIIFYCLGFEIPKLEGEILVFISPRNRVAQLDPQALCSLFITSYDLQGYAVGIPARFHAGLHTTLSLSVKFQIFRSQINIVT
jgi:hypothetical protein